MRSEQRHKGWNEIKTNDSWAIFKIMGEFVNGFEKMSRIGPCVSIFGSARTPKDHKYYQLAIDVAESICHAGYGVITGGGPGIMEAGNKGAHKAGGTSVGLNIDLPFETRDLSMVGTSNFHLFLKILDASSLSRLTQRARPIFSPIAHIANNSPKIRPCCRYRTLPEPTVHLSYPRGSN